MSGDGPPPATVTTAAAGDGPKVLMQGTVAFYEGTGGTVVMVLHIDGREPEKKVIPKMMVDMFTGGGGPAGAMLRKMFTAAQ